MDVAWPIRRQPCKRKSNIAARACLPAGKIPEMSGGLRAGAWYLCFTCRSCSQPIPFVECTADAKIPAGRVRTVSVRCPYPGCTAKHDYVTTDLFKVQAELPKA